MKRIPEVWYISCDMAEIKLRTVERRPVTLTPEEVKIVATAIAQMRAEEVVDPVKLFGEQVLAVDAHGGLR